MKLPAAAIFMMSWVAVVDPSHAAARLDAPAVRAFILAQDQAWERRDFTRYYSSFDPGAVIITVQTKHGREVSRSLRTIAGDREQAKRFFATHRAPIRETDTIEWVTIGPHGKNAHVRVREIAEIRKNARRKALHATTEQELALRSGHIVSLQLTEYDEER